MEREETREWQCGHENWEERKSEGKRRFESVIVKKSERAPNQYCFPRPGTEPELKVRGGGFTVSCIQWFRLSTSLLLSHIAASCLNFFKVSDCLF